MRKNNLYLLMIVIGLTALVLGSINWDLEGSATFGTAISSMAYSRNGSYIAFGDQGFIVFILNGTGQNFANLTGGSAISNDVAWTPDNKYVIDMNNDDSLRAYWTENWSSAFNKSIAHGAEAIAISPNGTFIAMASFAGNYIEILEMPNFQSTYNISMTAPLEVEFSNNTDLLAVGVNSGNVTVYHVGNWTPVVDGSFDRGGQVNSLCFDINTTYVLAGGENPNDLRAYGIMDFLNVSENPIVRNGVRARDCKISPDNQFLLIGAGNDAYLNYTGNWSYSEVPTKNYVNVVIKVDWADDRNSFAVGVSDEFVYVYNASITDLSVFSVDLVSPADASSTSNQPVNFSFTASSDTSEFVNGTISIFRDDGTLFYQNTRAFSGLALSGTYWNVSSFTPDNYLWSIKVCRGDGGVENCVQATNFTLTWVPYTEGTQTFSTPVLETSSQTFRINISLAVGQSVQNGDLIYNGTKYATGTKVSVTDSITQISKTITIPAGIPGFTSEARTFYWNLSVSDAGTGLITVANSTSNTQVVNEILFGLCDFVTLDVPMINFTLKDEVSDLVINSTSNATTFEATFNIGINGNNLIKNYSMSNLSVDTNFFTFCTTDVTNYFHVDMEASYSANGYSGRDYFIDGANLTSLMSDTDLYLIQEDIGTEFFINVLQNLFPLEDAIINIQKFFTGSGEYRTIEIDKTDVSGQIISYLDLEESYKFVIIKDGEILDIIVRSAICESAPCEMTLSISSDVGDIYSAYSEAFASNVLYNLSYNPTTRIITFDFIDVTGLATSFRMDVSKTSYNQTSELISHQRTYTSAGTLTYNMTGQSDGDYRVEVYVARSPDLFITFMNLLLSEKAVQLGMLGLFVAFLFVLTTIFSLAFRPSFLIMSVPLALFVIKLMGILALSNTALITLFVLAILGVAFLSR